MFEGVRSEKDVEKLKRHIMRDDALYAEFLAIRDELTHIDNNARVIVKRKFISSQNGERKMPSNAEILLWYKKRVAEGLEGKSDILEQTLKKLKVRSNSGVAVVSLLTKPYTCPGRCIYCPTEKNMPKSYLSREPAAARALANRFDPYKQIWSRLRALSINGHPVDKIEMIMIGGTWNFYDKEYQEWFTKESFRACNNWQAQEEGREVIPENHGHSLEKLQIINEQSHARIIGLSIETRPDYVTALELEWLRYLGVTKVELGVQHLDNAVLEFNKREMTKESIAEATELLRDYGFKLVYHMMPNLPLSNPVMDVEMFRELYSGKDFHPDMMKIYPCMVVRGSLLYKLVTQKKINYHAYDDTLLTQVLADAESFVPCYTRLIRVIRDIPADYIIVGSKKSNLREDVDAYQRARGVQQVDIRAREIRDSDVDPNDFELTETVYETEHGKEIFLQFENKKENKLAGFLRLRLPNEKSFVYTGNTYTEKSNETSQTALNWGLSKYKKASEEFMKNREFGVKEVLQGAALVRELHVYGTMKRVGEEGTQSQHTGMGKKLLAHAEKIAQENSYKKIAIISGVGVREYYRRRGYVLEGTYMVKEI